MSDLLRTSTPSAYQQLSEAGRARAHLLLAVLRPEPLSRSLSRQELREWLGRSQAQNLDPKAVWNGVLDLAKSFPPNTFSLDGFLVHRLPMWADLAPEEGSLTPSAAPSSAAPPNPAPAGTCPPGRTA